MVLSSLSPRSPSTATHSRFRSKATSTAQLAGLPIDLRTKRYSPGC
jgi:hypothetical protein